MTTAPITYRHPYEYVAVPIMRIKVVKRNEGIELLVMNER